MNDQLFEYRPNRFVKASRIVQANIYTKENTIRVAIDLDVDSTKERTVYSDPIPTVEKAREYIKSIPI